MAKTKKKLISDGIQYTGEEFIGEDTGFSYSYGDLGDMGQLDLFSDQDLPFLSQE